VIAGLLASIALAVWLYLLLARGSFWRCRERDDSRPAELPRWPSVTAVVPARDEASTIGACIGALLKQDYPGAWSVILVDDDSTDGTSDAARSAASACDSDGRLRLLTSRALPNGWTGKLWALKQGTDAAVSEGKPPGASGGGPGPDYLLLTDADIVHAPDSLRRLVARAECAHLVLSSLMVKLRCESFSERATIPAFVFFFQMLYPFAWVNRPQSSVAAAAGGCMLVRTDALRRAGGIEAIRGALIDDCALAKLLKAQGPIWLGLTERVRSLRAYPALADIRRMVVRSAYAQLGYSPLLLLATTAGMALTYLAPPLLTVFGGGIGRVIGLASWVLMTLAFLPTLRLYRLSPAWAVALPAIALLYLLFTFDSAYQHARGRGGSWKGRAQAYLGGRA
jgi:hopene-associated glycosyltransferase HpnB